MENILDRHGNRILCIHSAVCFYLYYYLLGTHVWCPDRNRFSAWLISAYSGAELLVFWQCPCGTVNESAHIGTIWYYGVCTSCTGRYFYFNSNDHWCADHYVYDPVETGAGDRGDNSDFSCDRVEMPFFHAECIPQCKKRDGSDQYRFWIRTFRTSHCQSFCKWGQRTRQIRFCKSELSRFQSGFLQSHGTVQCSDGIFYVYSFCDCNCSWWCTDHVGPVEYYWSDHIQPVCFHFRESGTKAFNDCGTDCEWNSQSAQICTTDADGGDAERRSGCDRTSGCKRQNWHWSCWICLWRRSWCASGCFTSYCTGRDDCICRIIWWW